MVYWLPLAAIALWLGWALFYCVRERIKDDI